MKLKLSIVTVPEFEKVPALKMLLRLLEVSEYVPPLMIDPELLNVVSESGLKEPKFINEAPAEFVIRSPCVLKLAPAALMTVPALLKVPKIDVKWVVPLLMKKAPAVFVIGACFWKEVPE